MCTNSSTTTHLQRRGVELSLLPCSGRVQVAWEHLGLDVASVSVRAALAGVAVLVSRLADPGGACGGRGSRWEKRSWFSEGQEL